MTAVRSITVAVHNVSKQGVVIAHAKLSGGDWGNGYQPRPGTELGVDATILVNEAQNVFTSLAGSVMLMPASGGTIAIDWSWPRGSGGGRHDDGHFPGWPAGDIDRDQRSVTAPAISGVRTDSSVVGALAATFRG
ncbi:MAG: hypothetical protein EOP58_08405 [Sphingomonadales bacterium]|nr:MAG: hypothetical protein EOP58_08405 [Sphingomonadales bacterium]